MPKLAVLHNCSSAFVIKLHGNIPVLRTGSAYPVLVMPEHTVLYSDMAFEQCGSEQRAPSGS